MKVLKFLTVLLVGALSSYLIGCASGGPVSGLIYTDVQGPVNATGAPRGPYHGQSCASSYLGLVALGDASITAASKAANVTQISHVEHSSTSILGLWAQYCTIVYGNRGIAPTGPLKVPAAPAANGTPAPAPAPAPGAAAPQAQPANGGL